MMDKDAITTNSDIFVDAYGQVAEATNEKVAFTSMLFTTAVLAARVSLSEDSLLVLVEEFKKIALEVFRKENKDKWIKKL